MATLWRHEPGVITTDDIERNLYWQVATAILSRRFRDFIEADPDGPLLSSQCLSL